MQMPRPTTRSEEPTIHSAGADDRADLRRLFESAAPDCAPRTLEELPELCGNARVLRGADGEILGAGALQPIDERRFEIRGLVVDPEARGEGHGRRLLAHLLAAADAAGRETVCVTRRPAFFARFGFHCAEADWLPDSLRPAVVHEGTDPPRVAMRRPVSVRRASGSPDPERGNMTTLMQHPRSEPAPATAPGLRIRPAQRRDIDVIVEAVKSSAEWYRPILDEKDMEEHEVDSAWAEENFRKRDFYIGEAGGESVGILSLQYFGEYAYLGYIYLFTEHVGQGFGQRLIRFAETTARRKGMKGMVLIAHPEATWARKAYLKYGFEIIETDRERILSWQDGVLRPYYEEGFDLYLYDLDPAARRRNVDAIQRQHVGRRRLGRKRNGVYA